jgi:hybrid cluster-associated redox disulfide protein
MLTWFYRRRQAKFSMLIKKDTTINEIIHQHPETVKFFTDLNMSCSGCFAVNFDTLENGALMHGMDVNLLIRKLERFIRGLPTAAGPYRQKN